MTLFTLKANFQPGQAPHIIIVTGPPTVHGWDLNPGPLSFEASPLKTELTRSDIPQRCDQTFGYPDQGVTQTCECLDQLMTQTCECHHPGMTHICNTMTMI